MTTKFREPKIPLLGTIYLSPDRRDLIVRHYGSVHSYDVDEAEELLEVLLDICPNAKALAHNCLLGEQKREYMAGGK